MDGPLFSKHVNLAIHGPVRHVIHNLFHKISVERCAMEEEYSFLIEEAKKSFALLERAKQHFALFVKKQAISTKSQRVNSQPCK